MTLRTALAFVVAAAFGLGAAAPAEAQLWKPKSKTAPAKPTAAKSKAKSRSKARATSSKRTVSKPKSSRNITDASVRVTSRRGDDRADPPARGDDDVDDAPRIYAVNGGG
ncbi:MAG: hypothetical protein R3B06_01950 [Kofleriaceae bacterium]